MKAAAEAVGAREARGTEELSIGIVVPVLNEAAALPRALESVRRVAGGCPVVVVDGGSSDGSADVARGFFPLEVRPRAGRRAQMDRGAKVLRTDVLLFLHADSQLPRDFQLLIRRALEDPCVAGGCFRLRFDAPVPILCFYAWFTRFPGRLFHFGDQAFFVRREIFERMGGFRGLPSLEDVDFLRRLRGYGKFAVLPEAVVTSARRFLRRGVIRQQLANVLIIALFELGFPARRLARLYPQIR